MCTVIFLLCIVDAMVLGFIEGAGLWRGGEDNLPLSALGSMGHFI